MVKYPGLGSSADTLIVSYINKDVRSFNAQGSPQGILREKFRQLVNFWPFPEKTYLPIWVEILLLFT